MAATVEDLMLPALLRNAVTRLARRLRAQRAVSSLGLSQIATLSTLDRHGPMTPGELAAHEKVQPPSMTRTLALLTAEGLVDRSPHPTDRRQSVVCVSAAGRRLLLDDRRRRDQWLAQRLRDLSPEELDVLRRAAALLERVAGS